jgi:hypothetical protein
MWIMDSGVSRREFLKYSLATGALIAAGDGIMENVMTEATTGIQGISAG